MVMKTVFLLLAVTWSALAELKRSCPPEADIRCSCMMKPKLFLGAILNCSKLGSLEKLQGNLKVLQGYHVDTLTLENFNVSSFPEDLFYGLHIEKLELQNFEVTEASFHPDRLHFRGLEDTLLKLDIVSSFSVHRSPWYLKLDHMKVLETIALNHNSILEVGNDWFAGGPETLKTLLFQANGLEKLGDRAFNKLMNLEFLSVIENNLRELTRSMFPSPAYRLDFLDFSHNKISDLPGDIFSGMPSLETVYLDHNLIHVLKERTWSAILPQLDLLSVDENPLECDDKLKWVCRSKKHDIVNGHCFASTDKTKIEISEFCGN